MADSERVYTSRQVASELGITQQMLSKYTQAYLQLSGDKILKQGRLGRSYSASQFQIIKTARSWVQSNTGVTLQDAMKRALAFSDRPIEVIEGIQAGNEIEAFRTALREEVAGPIVQRLEALQREVAELKAARENTRVFSEADTKPVDSPGESDVKSYSLLQRLAKRVFRV